MIGTVVIKWEITGVDRIGMIKVEIKTEVAVVIEKEIVVTTAIMIKTGTVVIIEITNIQTVVIWEMTEVMVMITIKWMIREEQWWW